jgi:serine/threonine-protein kinase
VASEPTTAPNVAVPVQVAKGDDAASARSTTQVSLPREITPEEARLAGVRSPMRRLLPIGLGIAALLAAGGVMLLRSGTTSTQTPDVTPTPVANQEPQPPPANPVVTPPANPVVTPPEVVTTPVVIPPPEEPKPLETQPVVRPRPAPSNIPSQAVLLSIIEGLERDLNARTAAGQNMNIARSQLDRLRKEAHDARDTSSRRSVATKIDFWEKSYLKRN